MSKFTSQILSFLEENKDDLPNIISSDLKLKIKDLELTSIYDDVEDIRYDVSFDDIVLATVSRVIIAIGTFK
jgi:hypothetical protein